MIAFVFPGQGSQQVGMGVSIAAACPAAQALWARAQVVLGYDLAALCAQGPAERLTDTRHAQPALLTVGLMYFEAARERGLEPALLAGHSLGEYTALVAAGALDFEEALRLVQQRADLMAAAPAGGMAAVIGLADDQIPALLELAGRDGLVVAANYNSPGQVVVSGEVAAIDTVLREAKGSGARMAVKLPVSGAFHSPLLAEAGAQMAELIDAAPFHDAGIPVYQNTTAAPATAAADLKAALRAQMTSPVRWTATIQNMAAAGATEFYELGPGAVLGGLIKRIDKSLTATAAEAWHAA